MGLHHLLWALVPVAWASTMRKTALEPVANNSQIALRPNLSWLDNSQSGPDFWGEIGRVPNAVVEPTQPAPDPWSKSVEYADETGPGTLIAPVDNSPRAYFEWRMRGGFTDPEEERVVYNDYIFQCRLIDAEPVSIIRFGRGLVDCGCTKLKRVAKYDAAGRRREPNVIEWPLQLGMT